MDYKFNKVVIVRFKVKTRGFQIGLQKIIMRIKVGKIYNNEKAIRPNSNPLIVPF